MYSRKRHKKAPDECELPPISYVQEMGGSSRLSGAAQLIEVFRNTLGLTLQLFRLLTLLGLVFSLLDLLAKLFINDDVEVAQDNKDNNQNHNGQSNCWDS